MNKKDYHSINKLKEALLRTDRKFILDCGHKVTLGEFLSNNIVIIQQGKNDLRIECTECYD